MISFTPRVRTTTPGKIGSEGVATDFAQPMFGPLQMVAASVGRHVPITMIENPAAKLLTGNSDCLRFIMPVRGLTWPIVPTLILFFGEKPPWPRVVPLTTDV